MKDESRDSSQKGAMTSRAKLDQSTTRFRPFALALKTIFLVVTATAYEFASTNSAHSVGKNVLPDTVTCVQQQGNASALPTPYEHWTGDLDGMIKRRQTRALVVYSPTAFFYDLEQALISGLGDLVAIPVAITPERRQKVAFSAPIATVKQIVVTGPSGAAVKSLDDLSGKEIFVNPLAVYPESLVHLNKSLESQGK